MAEKTKQQNAENESEEEGLASRFCSSTFPITR